MHSFVFLCILVCQTATGRRRAASSRSRWHPSWSTTPPRRLGASSRTPSSLLSPLGRSASTFTCSAETTRALASLSWHRRPSPRLEVRNKTQPVHKKVQCGGISRIYVFSGLGFLIHIRNMLPAGQSDHFNKRMTLAASLFDQQHNEGWRFWFRVKWLNNSSMGCHEIRRSCPSQDEL